jgi:hypothetical protein
LWQFERRFGAISHPPQSKLVARTHEIGLFGNGNHCDFLVAEVRSFNGSSNGVRNFYRKTRVAVPNRADNGYSDVKNGTQPVETEFLRSPLPKNYRWKFSFAKPIDLSASSGRKNLYVVFINNSGENNSWDSMFCLGCG